MQDTELYRHVLGLEKPWKVNRVELDIRGERVDVWGVHEEGLRWVCPECRTELAIGEAYSSAVFLLAGLFQAAHQGFNAGQSLERLLNIHTKTGADVLIQSMLVARGKQDGLLDAQAVNQFC